MLSPSFATPPIPAVRAAAAVEPIRNILVGMAQLTAAQRMEPEGSWSRTVVAGLSAAERRRNRLVFEGLGDALIPEQDYTDFLAYVDSLSAGAPTVLAQRVAAAERTPIDPALRAEVEALRQDPTAMQALITTHLRTLWESRFAAVWKQKLNTLEYMVRELDARCWPTTSAADAIRAFIRRELPDAVSMQLAGVEQVVFVPSPFVHLHGARLGSPSTLWLFMHADPWTLPMRSEPIQRSEALRPLQALADETRLQILELLAAHGAMEAQEIIGHLAVTQSTVSRHLKQLQRVDLVSEARGAGANKAYRLRPEALDQHFQTLKRLLSSENARQVLNDPRLDQPPELRRFLDRQVRVTDWPSKVRDQHVVLAYLITKFEAAQDYSEQEVTALLEQWHTYGDPAFLRRSLIDFGYLSRTTNGARYWRTEQSE